MSLPLDTHPFVFLCYRDCIPDTNTAFSPGIWHCWQLEDDVSHSGVRPLASICMHWQDVSVAADALEQLPCPSRRWKPEETLSFFHNTILLVQGHLSPTRIHSQPSVCLRKLTESKKRAGVAQSSAAVLDGQRRLYSPKKRAGVAQSYSTLAISKN